MLKVGDKAHYLGRIPGVRIGSGCRTSVWNDVVILEDEYSGRYLKIRGRISWGGVHTIWVVRSDLDESCFLKKRNV